jgi:hypothetical protein
MRRPSILVASGAMLVSLLLLGSRSVSALPAPSAHRIAVDIRGPVALVQVTRTVKPPPRAAERGETLLDLALPERSHLLEVEISDGGRWRRAEKVEQSRARDLYLEAARAQGTNPASEPFDDSATHRIRVARPAEGSGKSAVMVRYRFSSLLDYAEGRHRLRFPASPELTPVAADVSLSTVAPAGSAGLADIDIGGVHTTLRPGTLRSVMNGRSPSRAGWEISYTLRDSKLSEPVEAVAASAPLGNGGQAALAFTVRGAATRPAAIPDRALFVIDRSRSVGLPGLAAERDVVQRLLEVLPPSTHFDALFFDRNVQRLFPMSRPATREAISAVESEMVPTRMVNGTDLEGALRAAGDLLRREAEAFAPRALLVVITDGAIPEQQTGPALARALGATPGVDLMVAVLVVRAADEDPLAPGPHEVLRALPQARGGIERELRSNEVEEAVNAFVRTLTLGGDAFAVRVADNGGKEGRRLADALAPGQGLSGVVRLEGKARGSLGLQTSTRGHTRRIPLRPLPVAATWLAPHLEEPARASDGGPRELRVVTAPRLAALVEKVAHPAPPAPAPVTRGFMERSVVRDTLSLAYMPRARACYQGRSGATPASRDLTGRVRLALDLIRGEVADARIESSTLSQPTIESCLRDGAFALEVPRAYRNDQAVTAILNMVFRPRTPEKKRAGEDAIGAEIDMVLEDLHRFEEAAKAK